MSSIVIRAGTKDNTDSVIRKFQKKIQLENVVQEYRDRQFYKKRSQLRQERLAERQRKIKRSNRLAA